MQRDGFFKVGTDLLGNKIGKTDNWLVAANFTSSIPKSINPLAILPFEIPLKFFVEIDSDVADGSQSIILQQVENGVAVRMAVLYLLAGINS
jgi:aspartate carbamoyltransferase catalytic subunit